MSFWEDKQFYGTITLKEKVRVTDPCYDMEVWCAGDLEDVYPGTYECRCEHADEGAWGNRIANIEIRHEDFLFCEPNEATDFEVGVDSGQAGFFDYDYYKNVQSSEIKENRFYENVCDTTLSSEQAGIIDNVGFVSSSGYGDGGYTCYIGKNSDGKIVSMKIVFIGDSNEEDEYNEDDDWNDEYEDNNDEEYLEDEDDE